MTGEAVQHLGHLQPVLEHLARELDEVAVDAGAGEMGVGDVGQKAVQRVAELVEQRAGIVQAEQRRAPPVGLEKFMTLTMIGRMSPRSFSWPLKPLAQAPLRFAARAK
jgi:hypothetical protein